MTVLGTAYIVIAPEASAFPEALEGEVAAGAEAAGATLTEVLGAAGDEAAGSISASIDAALGSIDASATEAGATLAAGISAGFGASDLGGDLGDQMNAGISGSGGGGSATGKTLAGGIADGAAGGLSARGSAIGGDFAKRIVGGAAAIGAVDIFKGAIDESTDLAKAIDSVKTIFGSAATEVLELGKNSATSLGQSNLDVLTAATNYGNLLRSLGFTQAAAATASTGLIKVATDLASIRNVPVSTALAAIQSGLAGMSRPLRQFGIDLTTANLTQQAVKDGLIAQGQALTDAAKAQAAYELILKDSTVSQGNFADTADSTANKQKILSAEISNAKAALGNELQPAYRDLLAVGGEVLKFFTALPESVQVGSIALIGVVGAFKALSSGETTFLATGGEKLLAFLKGLTGGVAEVNAGGDSAAATEVALGTSAEAAVPGVEALTAALLEQVVVMKQIAELQLENGAGAEIPQASRVFAAGTSGAAEEVGPGALAEAPVAGSSIVTDVSLLNSGAAAETAATGATIGLGAATGGLLAVLAGGFAVYSAWSKNNDRVKTESGDLATSIKSDSETISAALTQQYNTILTTRKGFESALTASGISKKEITDIIAADPGAFDQFRHLFHDEAGESVDYLAAHLDTLGDKIPKAVRPVVDSLIQMSQAGALTEAQVRDIIDGITDLDKEGKSAGVSLAALGERFYDQALKVGFSATTLKQFNILMSDQSSLTDKKKALSELEDEYPKIAQKLGLIPSAAKAADTALDGVGATATAAAQEMLTFGSDLDKANQVVTSAIGAAQGYESAQRAVTAAETTLAEARKETTAQGEDALAVEQRLADARLTLAQAQDKAQKLAATPLAAIPAGETLADLTAEQQQQLSQQTSDRQDAFTAVIKGQQGVAAAQADVTKQKVTAAQAEKDAEADLADKQTAAAQSAITYQLSLLQLGAVLKDNPKATDAVTASLQNLRDRGIITPDEFNGFVFELGIVKQNATDLGGAVDGLAAKTNSTTLDINNVPINGKLTDTENRINSLAGALDKKLQGGATVAEILQGGDGDNSQPGKTAAQLRADATKQDQIATVGFSNGNPGSQITGRNDATTAKGIASELTEANKELAAALNSQRTSSDPNAFDKTIAAERQRIQDLNDLAALAKTPAPAPTSAPAGNQGIIGNAVAKASGIAQVQAAIIGDQARIGFDHALLDGMAPGSKAAQSVGLDLFYTTIELQNLQHLLALAQGRAGGGPTQSGIPYIVNEPGDGEIVMFGNQGHVFSARDALTRALQNPTQTAQSTPSVPASPPPIENLHVYSPTGDPSDMFKAAWDGLEEVQYLHGLGTGPTTKTGS